MIITPKMEPGEIQIVQEAILWSQNIRLNFFYLLW